MTEMKKPAPIVVMLDGVQLDLLIEALDSHRYWQLSDQNYRRDGYLMEPGTDDPENLGEMVAAQELINKLEALRPKTDAQQFDDEGFASSRGGNVAGRRYLNKGYVHIKRMGDKDAACQVVLHGAMERAPDLVLDISDPSNDLSTVTCPGCKHVLGIEPCGQH